MVHKEMVDDTLSKMPDTTTLHTLADFFKIMGDATRCKLLFALLQNEMCVCDLANVLSMSKSSISHQLKKMRASGVVKCEKTGKQVFYSLDDNHVFEIFNISLKHISHIQEEKI